MAISDSERKPKNRMVKLGQILSTKTPENLSTYAIKGTVIVLYLPVIINLSKIATGHRQKRETKAAANTFGIANLLNLVAPKKNRAEQAI